MFMCILVSKLHIIAKVYFSLAFLVLDNFKAPKLFDSFVTDSATPYYIDAFRLPSE